MKRIFVIMPLILLIVAIVVLILINNQAKNGRHFSRMTVKVVNEEGKPITEADVYIGFGISTDWSGNKGKTFHGKSNTDGEFSATFNGLNKIGGSVFKKGYYRTSYSLEQQQPGKVFWHPWNPTMEIVLREKVNPIPLYAKYNNLIITNVNQTPVGFDLFVGDFVSPLGDGKTNDLLFVLDKKRKSRYDYTWNFKINTYGHNNGIIEVLSDDFIPESVLPVPNSAYLGEYSARSIESSYISNKTPNEKPIFKTSYSNDCFFIKIRSSYINGKTNCYYGKLTGLNFQTLKEGLRFKFTYYLNPIPNDRNLEFNIESNLFRNISSLEEVTHP